MLATLEIPHMDGIIIPATCQPLPIRTHFERLNCPLMSLEDPQALPALNVHPRSMPSLPPLSSSPPVELQASAYTSEPGSLQDCRRSPLCTSQTATSPLPLLPPPLTSLVPSGLQATLMTIPRCPRSEA